MKTSPLEDLGTNLILWLLVLGLAIVNVFLLRQNIQLRTQIDKRKSLNLQIGDGVEAFSGIGLRGESIKIDYSNNSKKRLFLYFTPTCKFCQQQFPEWKELLKQANNQTEVYGLVSKREKPDEIENFLHLFDCDSTSETPLQIIFVSNEMLEAYKLHSTPTTLLISPEGKAERIWLGKWGNNEKELAFAWLR